MLIADLEWCEWSDPSSRKRWRWLIWCVWRLLRTPLPRRWRSLRSWSVGSGGNLRGKTRKQPRRPTDRRPLRSSTNVHRFRRHHLKRLFSNKSKNETSDGFISKATGKYLSSIFLFLRQGSGLRGLILGMDRRTFSKLNGPVGYEAPCRFQFLDNYTGLHAGVNVKGLFSTETLSCLECWNEDSCRHWQSGCHNRCEESHGHVDQHVGEDARVGCHEVLVDFLVLPPEINREITSVFNPTFSSI